MFESEISSFLRKHVTLLRVLFLATDLLLLASAEMVGFRLVLRSSLAVLRTRGVNRKNILIIGAGKAGQRFHTVVSNNPGYGYRVIGFLDDNGVSSKVRPMILGKLNDLT